MVLLKPLVACHIEKFGPKRFHLIDGLGINWSVTNIVIVWLWYSLAILEPVFPLYRNQLTDFIVNQFIGFFMAETMVKSE